MPPTAPTNPPLRDLDHALGRPGGSRMASWHLGVATVAIACQVLSPAIASVGQVILMLTALLRVIDDRRTGAADPTPLRLVTRRPAVILGLCLAAWMVAAVAWSPDPAEGLARFRPLRAVLFVAALLPLADRPLPLILGAAVGASIEAIFQALMVTGVLVDPHNRPWSVSGGLSPHPGNVGLWSGSAAILLLAALVRVRRGLGVRVAMSVGVLVCIAGLVISGNRSLLVGLPVAMLVLVATWMWRSDWRRRLQLGGGVAILFAGIVLLPAVAPDFPSVQRLRGLVRELAPGPASAEGEVLDTSGGLRLFWWREAVPIVAAAPWFGHGSGSTEIVYDAHIDGLEPSTVPPRGRTDNPHSTIVHALVETGAVGAFLGLAFIFAAVSDGVRTTRIDPRLEGLPAAWTLLAIYAVGNTVHLSPYSLFLSCTLAALSIGPVVRRMQGGPRLTAT